MITLETKRLSIRQLTSADTAFIVDLLNQPSFITNIGDRGVRSEEDALNYLQKGPLDSYTRHGFGLWLVERREDHACLGMCGLIKRKELEHVDLGYAFLPLYWGQGYAFEATSAVMDYARQNLKLQRLVAIVAPGNQSSIHLLHKLGFNEERTITWPADNTTLLLFGWNSDPT